MATATTTQFAEKAIAPVTSGDVAEAIRAAYEASRAVYPLGGGTALDYGNPPTEPGHQLDLTGLNKIVDYTPRDMTILVETSVRMADLAATLAAEGQHLPIDVPRAGEATIGGVVATNWNGPRRYGHGTIRDYVIGIHAVDGRGISFKGGGRVVKNVAGYDFCKLLTGSLGTLGVITQLALKVKPQVEQSATVVATCPDLASVDKMLSRLVDLPAPPVAIDLLVGPDWSATIRNQGSTIVIRLEGTAPEMAWLCKQVQNELQLGGGTFVAHLDPAEADALWARQIEFSDRGAGDAADDSPMVVKVSVPPSAVTRLVAELLKIDPDCSILANAGNGIIFARFKHFRQQDLTTVLLGNLRPAAIQNGGSLTVVSSKLDGLTPHLRWGGRTEAIVLMERIKQKFDPKNILNPGRFAYH